MSCFNAVNKTSVQEEICIKALEVDNKFIIAHTERYCTVKKPGENPG